MCHDKLTGIRQTHVFVILVMFLLLPGSGNRCLAGTLAQEMRRYLDARAKFDVVDFSKIENGGMVAKLLPARDKREVAVCGIIPIKVPPEEGFRAFQEYFSRQDKKPGTRSNSFSSSPNIADLQTLTLEKSDIEDLKKCRVADCNLRLSAAMIERFQREVDWNAPDYSKQATDLFRRIILDYVLDYLSRGDEALIEYSDKRQTVSLKKEQDALLKELIWISNYAPEFFEYLQNAQRPEPSNIKKSVGWAKVKFGLKPVIIITQTITYTTADKSDGGAQVLSVSKQIYANHYFDSSLGLMALIRPAEPDAAAGTTADSYLLYVNHSRSSSFEGAFSKFKRGIVEQEAIGKLKHLLQKTKSLAEFRHINQNVPPDPSAKEKVVEWLNDQNYFIWLLILIGAFTAVNWFGRPIAKKRRHLSGYFDRF